MRVPLLGLLLVSTLPVFAQSLVSSRISAGIDLGAGFKGQQVAPSIAYYQLLNIGEKRMFSIGYTLKFGTFYAQNLDYTTAPARLSRGKSGFSALGAPLVINNIDTLSMANASVTNLNLGLRAQVQLGPVQLGVSADVLGLSVGKSRTGHYQSSTGQFNVPTSTGADSLLAFTGTNANQSASPTNANLRLLGDNNIGTLSSEIYARIRVGQRLGIKVGYQWLTTELSTKNRDVKADNNRFRNRTNFPYLALTFPLFQ